MQNNAYNATASVRKRYDSGTATVTVTVRIMEVAGRNQFPRCEFGQEIVLQPTPACSALYGSAEDLFQGCEAGAQSGALYATRHHREKYEVVFTHFDGRQLPPDCAIGFAAAAALACFRALDLKDEAKDVQMNGWEEVPTAA